MKKSKKIRNKKDIRLYYKQATCTDLEWVNNRFDKKSGNVIIKKSGRLKILHVQGVRFYTIWFCNFILLIRHLFRGY